MWTLYVAIFIAFIFLLDYFLIDRRQYELVKKLNSPFRLPLIGHTWLFLGVGPKDTLKFCQKIGEKYIKKHPEMVCLYKGTALEVALADYKYAEKILTSPQFITKSSMYDFLVEVFGDGLLFSTQQKWFNRRRIITPTFHFKILRQFFDVFQKQNDNLLVELEEIADGRIFDITPYIGMSVLKSLCETAMGCEINEKDFSYLNAIKELSYYVATSFLSPWHKIEFIYNLTPTKKAQDKCKKIVQDFTIKLIEERRQLLSKNDENSNFINIDDEAFGLKKKMCLLDVLLMSTINNEPLTNADIQEEVNTFTFAGHDTTKTAISATLFTISRHPEVQEKLNKEIESVLGPNGELTFNSLNDFKYLEMVIKESLRLYPPVPLISRYLPQEMDFGDFVVPGNANYIISLIFLLRDPKIFENPEEFIPERYLGDVPPFGFIPFSAGQKFATIYMKTTLINILRNFEILPGNIDPELEIQVTLKANGFFLALKKKVK